MRFDVFVCVNVVLMKKVIVSSHDLKEIQKESEFQTKTKKTFM